MANQQGWWQLEYHPIDSNQDEAFEISENDLQHIAQLITEGFTEGEVVKDEDTDNGTDN